MAVKAKFRCTSVTDNGYNKSADFSAVYGKEGENADYAKATPTGSLKISIDKETKASEFFQPQKEYYLVFEEAPAQ
jgi:hypothetical protein